MAAFPFPVETIAIQRTVRLVSTGRLKGAVLSTLVSRDRLGDLEEIDGATNGRLMAEEVKIRVGELVASVPHAALINAAFSYPRPGELNRFNGPGRGAWYSALKVDTCLAEVIFHINRELERVNRFITVMECSELFASFAGRFVDLRKVSSRPECLHPDITIGYPAGNVLAELTRGEGDNGIIYPSVRDKKKGMCLVALWPHAVQSVAQGGILRLTWHGHQIPKIVRV